MIDAAGLRVMKAIADEGSFTGAALSLGYSQPAISQMVRRLEQRTGTVLVDRVGRQVRLTEAGQVLARHATGVLAALDAAEEEVAAIAGLRSGRVRLTSFPSATATIVPPALATVRREYPDVSVSFAEAEPAEAITSLRAGECDLVIAFSYDDATLADGEADLDGLSVLPLLEDPVLLALPADHPLAAAPSVRLEQVAQEDWIAGCVRCRRHLLSLAGESGFSPVVSYEIEDYVTQLGLVAAGLGVALVPRLIAETAPSSGVVITATEPASIRHIMAVTTPDLARVPAVAATVSALQASAASCFTAPA